MRDYKVNSEMTWCLWLDEHSEPPLNTPIWMLCEEDTCDPTLYPSIFRVMIHEYDDTSGMTLRSIEKGKMWKFRLLDFDPEHEDEFLNPNMWTFIAWREMTDHAGTYDNFMKEHNREFHQNWSID
ncbi:MAG: hypothetical protein M0R77_15030 [Gammaproteobacteria bacterium]|nr:hypothetical protein [Gammaproteobacteria bacterium]